MKTLPNDPDQTPRETPEQTRLISNAIDTKEATILGDGGHSKDCCWISVQWGERFFIFLNDTGPSEWCWEVSEKGARNYVD